MEEPEWVDDIPDVDTIPDETPAPTVPIEDSVYDAFVRDAYPDIEAVKVELPYVHDSNGETVTALLGYDRVDGDISQLEELTDTEYEVGISTQVTVEDGKIVEADCATVRNENPYPDGASPEAERWDRFVRQFQRRGG